MANRPKVIVLAVITLLYSPAPTPTILRSRVRKLPMTVIQERTMTPDTAHWADPESMGECPGLLSHDGAISAQSVAAITMRQSVRRSFER